MNLLVDMFLYPYLIICLKYNPDIENRLVVAKGEGWSGRLGSSDTNYYI